MREKKEKEEECGDDAQSEEKEGKEKKSRKERTKRRTKEQQTRGNAVVGLRVALKLHRGGIVDLGAENFQSSVKLVFRS